MGFSRQKYWSGLPCPLPGDLSDPRIKPRSLPSPALVGRLFTRWAIRKALYEVVCHSFRNRWIKTVKPSNLLSWIFFLTSVCQFSRSVVSDSLQPHESQHARPPCPSPTPRVYPNSCPLSCWCYPAISSSVVPFSSCPQSLPASDSFPISQLFTWGGQSTGVSALASFLPKKSQGWSPSIAKNGS